MLGIMALGLPQLAAAQDSTQVSNKLLSKPSAKLTVFPAAFYSPETSFAFGAKAILVRRPAGSLITGRPSSHSLTFFYTLRHQIISTYRTDLWRRQNQRHWLGTLNFVNYPYVFFGIGNNSTIVNEEDYTTQALFGSLQYERKVSPSVYLGAQLDFREEQISKTDPEGQLAQRTIRGFDGVRAFGLGPTVSFDNRNHLYTPKKGSFHQASVSSFRKALGSNSNFVRYKLDLRKYSSAIGPGVLAAQGLFTFTTGQVPFQYLSSIGGGTVLRGFLDTRFRDRHAMVYQVEYRVPLFWRLGAVAFGGAGKVASSLSDYTPKDLHFAAGGGLRFRLNEEGINLRIDMAVSEEMPGVYFSLYEAF